MALINVDAEKAAVAAVDEFDNKIVPDLPAILDSFAKSIVRELKGSLAGHTVTVTTTIKIE